jgi:hypothetical protein
MPHILEHVAENDCSHSPVPRKEEEHDNPGHRTRDTSEVNVEIERVLVPFEPVS